MSSVGLTLEFASRVAVVLLLAGIRKFNPQLVLWANLTRDLTRITGLISAQVET